MRERTARFEQLEPRHLLTVVSGFAFLDSDLSGTIDGSEKVRSGVSIALQGTLTNGTLDTQHVRTDSAGHYSFQNKNYSVDALHPLTAFVDSLSTDLRIPTGLDPNWVATGRFDANATTDLAVLNRVSQTVSILVSNSNGDFSLIQTVAQLAPQATSLSVGDFFQADGLDDIVVGYDDTSYVTVLKNQGGGVFLRSNVQTGAAPAWMTAIDFDNDGDLDIVASNQFDDTLSLLVNSNGAFTWQNLNTHINDNANTFITTIRSRLAPGSAVLLIGDLGNKSANIFSLTPTRQINLLTSVGLNTIAQQMISGDLDRDGYDDLIYVAEDKKTINVRLSTAAGFTATDFYSLKLGDVINGLKLADVDGDGDLDIVVNPTGVILNDSGLLPGPSQLKTSAFIPNEAPSSPPAVGDFNNDGLMDFAWSYQTTTGQDGVQISHGQFESPHLLNAFAGSTTIHVDMGVTPIIAEGHQISGDFNGSGVTDVVDYSIWRRHYGISSGVGLLADGNHDHKVDSADYVTWRNALGSAAASFAQLASQNLPIASYSASSAAADAHFAFDGNTNTAWSSSALPGDTGQWIEVNLQNRQYLDHVSLIVEQGLTGFTHHEVYVSDAPIGSDRSHATRANALERSTGNGDVLEISLAGIKGKYVQILTTVSPTFVAWKEVKVYSQGIAPAEKPAQLQNPLKDVTGARLQPIFQWSNVPGVVTYSLQLYDSSGIPIAGRRYDVPAAYGDITVFTFSDADHDTNDLQGNKQYYWDVTAVDGLGNVLTSERWGFTTRTASAPPAAPTNLRVDNLYARAVDIRWDDNSNNEEEFRIALSTDGVNFDNVGTTAPNDVSFRISDLNPSTRYYVKVRAHNSAGYSVYTLTIPIDTLQEAPVAPGNLQIDNIFARAVDIRWDDVAKEDDYYIALSTDGVNYNNAGTTSANVTNVRISNLNPVTHYYIQVRAHNSVGFSPYSNVIQFTTLQEAPVAPANLRIDNIFARAVDIRWDDVSNEDDYYIALSTDGVNYNNAGTTSANVTNVRISNLNPVTHYYIKVRAHNSIDFSPYSNVIQFTTLQEAPVAPGNSRVDNIFARAVDIRWDDVSNEDDYYIALSTDGVNFNNAGTTSANDISFRINGLNPVTHYYIKVRAHNSIDFSPYSNVIEFTTLQEAPAAPANLQVVNLFARSVDIQWDNVPNEDDFYIAYSTDNVNFNNAGTTLANDTAFRITGLNPSTHYYAKVRAHNSAGFSEYSNTIQFTTKASGSGAFLPGLAASAPPPTSAGSSVLEGVTVSDPSFTRARDLILAELARPSSSTPPQESLPSNVRIVAYDWWNSEEWDGLVTSLATRRG